MQYKIYQSGVKPARELVLFFNGWAMTPESVEHLSLPEGVDLMVVWDYRDDAFPYAVVEAYGEIHLVGWSMGVWAADRLLGQHPLRERLITATAVAGTGYPMDDHYGIPQAIFRGTLEGLSEDNRERFNRRMVGGKSLRHLFEALKKRPTQEIRDELERVGLLMEQSEHPMPNEAALGLWQRAIIGGEDRIIPRENQLRYWQEMAVPIDLLPKGAHYLFMEFSAWSELF